MPTHTIFLSLTLAIIAGLFASTGCDGGCGSQGQGPAFTDTEPLSAVNIVALKKNGLSDALIIKAIKEKGITRKWTKRDRTTIRSARLSRSLLEAVVLARQRLDEGSNDYEEWGDPGFHRLTGLEIEEMKDPLPPGMVFVDEARTFLPGFPNGSANVRVSTFIIDRKQKGSFVTWETARQLCKARGLDLPSEAQYQTALKAGKIEINPGVYDWMLDCYGQNFIRRVHGKKDPVNQDQCDQYPGVWTVDYQARSNSKYAFCRKQRDGHGHGFWVQDVRKKDMGYRCVDSSGFYRDD